MATSTETAILDPQPGFGYRGLDLSGWLADLVATGRCFCCGSPTDLLIGGDSLLLVRCPRCDAEISGELSEAD